MLLRAKQFERDMFNSEVIDPEGVHHEFNQGPHGRKADFDKIPTRSPLFDRWVDLEITYIREEYDRQPDAVVGVANGTNRFAEAVAKALGSEVLFLATEKQGGSKPALTAEARSLAREFRPVFALVLEDVGTEGTNSTPAAQSTLEAGIGRVEVLNTLQRSATLPRLDEAGISYRSIIVHILENYTPEGCHEKGFCAKGWKLIPYGDEPHV